MRHLPVFIAVAALAASFLFVGCGPKPQPAPPQTAESSSPPPYTDAKGNLICPVTGEVIKSVKDAAGFQDYKGKRYYFCCSMCPPKFKADPDKYVVRHELEKM